MRNVLVGLLTAAFLAGFVVLNPSILPAEVRGLVGVGPSRLGDSPEVKGSGTYRYMQHQPGNASVPVTYDPCRPIRVEINPDGVAEPDRARGVVLDAMQEVAGATGLRLDYSGASDDRPRWRSATEPVLGGPRPVLISFATSAEVPELKGRVAGIGGSTAVRRDGFSRYVSGQVTLDITTIDALLDEPGGQQVARAIVMHELGHLVGLAHVDDERELMNAANRGQLDFGPGDREGLAELGRGRCA